MADNKKSFLAYAEWNETFKMLSDEEAGKLIKHLLSYVNDENPQLDDRLLKLVFEPIKLQLKRDSLKIKKGILHWNWKGGISKENHVIRNSTSIKYWRVEIFERDLYTCQHCGKIGGKLNAHHIKSFSEYPDLRFSIDNGITLCKQCHINEHKRINNERKYHFL